MEYRTASVSGAENTFSKEAEGSGNECIWVCVDVGLVRPTWKVLVWRRVYYKENDSDTHSVCI